CLDTTKFTQHYNMSYLLIEFNQIKSCYTVRSLPLLIINQIAKVISHNPPGIRRYILQGLPNNSIKKPKEKTVYPITPQIANHDCVILCLYNIKHIGILPSPKTSIARKYP